MLTREGEGTDMSDDERKTKLTPTDAESVRVLVEAQAATAFNARAALRLAAAAKDELDEKMRHLRIKYRIERGHGIDPDTGEIRGPAQSEA